MSDWHPEGITHEMADAIMACREDGLSYRMISAKLTVTEHYVEKTVKAWRAVHEKLKRPVQARVLPPSSIPWPDMKRLMAGR